MDTFGFEIKYKKKEDQMSSVVGPAADDGSIVLSSGAAAYYQQVVDMDTSVKNENDLIRRYREISLHPECDSAIEEIVNEAITVDDNGSVCSLNIEKLNVSEGIKKKFLTEFEEVKALLDFDNKAHDLFRSWYIDGRQYHLITLDPQKSKEGILKVELVDSRKMRKIKRVDKERDKKTGVELVKKVEEYYIYNEQGMNASSAQGVKLSLDSVAYVPSGLFDQNSNMMLGYLHKAIRPVNMLKMLEDAVVIYTIARAPERRVFYIDVGTLPKVKAEQYVNNIMNKYKNKIVYDASTGEIRDDRKYMSMLEDFWMPRREGGKGTEITTLQGGASIGQMDHVNYFQQKLYQSLNVPVSRLLPQQGFTLGRSNEITRDELKFNKFVKRLRNRYSQLLIDLLRVQLVAKNVVRADDWREVEKFLSVDFEDDNNFVELRDAELWSNRFNMLNLAQPYIGTYVSPVWVQRNILHLTDEEIEQMEKENKEAKPEFLPPPPEEPQANESLDILFGDENERTRNGP